MDFGNLIQRLYPFSFQVDAELTMDHIHHRMSGVFPVACNGTRLNEVFLLRRPKAEASWDLLTRSHLTSFELVGRTKPAMLRGAVVQLDADTAWFIGTPVFREIGELKEHGFRLDDFPPFDTTLDVQLALSGTRSALRDAENLADSLRRLNASNAEQIQNLNQHVVRNSADSGLGRAISSILHDLNSQFGIAVAGSHMVKDSLDILNEELSREAPNLDVMRDAMVDINEMNAVVRQSVLRGVEFIGSYKSISIDQSSGRQREVELLGYVRQMAESMRPLTRSKTITIQVDGDPTIRINEPGMVAQIVMNLVENAFRHAFHGREGGNITFQVAREGEGVCLRYEDDGIGMTPDVLHKHLDPFFTTKPTEGGSGLGAYSIAVIVRDNLNGTLNVWSELGKGTRYEMRFPIPAT